MRTQKIIYAGKVSFSLEDGELIKDLILSFVTWRCSFDAHSAEMWGIPLFSSNDAEYRRMMERIHYFQNHKPQLYKATVGVWIKHKNPLQFWHEMNWILTFNRLPLI